MLSLQFQEHELLHNLEFLLLWAAAEVPRLAVITGALMKRRKQGEDSDANSNQMSQIKNNAK